MRLNFILWRRKLNRQKCVIHCLVNSSEAEIVTDSKKPCFSIYLLVNSPLVSLNSLMSILPTPYVYEPKPISQVWLSNGQLPISNSQLALNVAGPLHTFIPALSTDTSVTNFVRPPARVTLSSPLKSRRGYDLTLTCTFPSCLLS